jgi:ACR3 family arsenite efflux pump ArsB
VSDDRDWPDPQRTSGDPQRVRYRVAVSAVVAVVLVALFWRYVLEVLPRLWPPREPLSRWATLVLLQLLGFVMIPLAVGSLLGDWLYERREG